MKSSSIVLIRLPGRDRRKLGLGRRSASKQVFTGEPTTLPKHASSPTAPPARSSRRARSSTAAGASKLPRAVLIAKEPPARSPPDERLLAYSTPHDEIQDVLFLGDDRPVVVRTRVLVDGRGFRLAWGDFVASTVSLPGSRTTTAYLTQSRRRTPGTRSRASSRMAARSRGASRTTIQAGPKLDEDKDDRVSFSELMAYLYAPIRPVRRPTRARGPTRGRSRSSRRSTGTATGSSLEAGSRRGGRRFSGRFDLNEDEALHRGRGRAVSRGGSPTRGDS